MNKSEKRSINRANLRLETLKGIANGKLQCKCCKEKRIWALVFDHINGGGTAHRKNNKSNPTMVLVRRDYKKLGYWPIDTYQILCATCNHGKRMNNGICPHIKGVKFKLMNNKINLALKSYSKVFLATVLGLFLSDGADIFAVDWSDFRTYLSAGFASLLPLIITALDPQDTRFGVNAE